jgi:hypothetical protein
MSRSARGWLTVQCLTSTSATAAARLQRCVASAQVLKDARNIALTVIAYSKLVRDALMIHSQRPSHDSFWYYRSHIGACKLCDQHLCELVNIRVLHHRCVVVC